MIGINMEVTARTRGEEHGYFAPLVRKGSNLRLVLPEERNQKRIDRPRTEWDLLHGVIRAFRRGDIPVARAYIAEHAAERVDRILHLLAVWEAEIGRVELAREAAALRFGLKNL
jgi:hypothetical protein